MKLEEYEAEFLIPYTPDDVASIRAALQRYSALIQDGNAFRDGYITAHFQPKVDEVAFSFFDRNPSLQTFLRESCPSYRYRSEQSENIIECTLTETLFFLCAVQYAELKDDLKQACEAITAYARRLNDSSEMWITSEWAFGVEPLQIAATVYPEWGYLFAGFFVPNWDAEHMLEPLGALADWAGRLGVNDHTVKAFCFCDNKMAREMMLGYTSWDGLDEDMVVDGKFPLVPALRRSTEAMERFQEQLVRRFEEQPLIQDVGESYGEEVVVKDPVTDIMMDMLLSVHPCDAWDEDFDIDEYLTIRLVQKSAAREIEEIQASAAEKGISLEAQIPEEPPVPEAAEADENTRSVINWREFIQVAITPGALVWEYILRGDRPEILNDLKEENVLKLARKKKCRLYEELNEHCYDMDDFFEDLEEYLEPLFHGFQDAATREMLGSDADSSTLILRFSDVIHRLCGQKPFEDSYIEDLCETYEVCESPEVLKARFPMDWKADFRRHTKEYTGYSSLITLESLERLAELIYEHREEARTFLTETYFQLPPEGSEEDDEPVFRRKTLSPVELLCLALYLYKSDVLREQKDALTEAAEAYVAHYGEKVMLSLLHKEMSVPDKDTMQRIAEGDDYGFTPEEMSRCQSKFADWLLVKHYLRQGEWKGGDKPEEKDLLDHVLLRMIKHLDVEDRTPISQSQLCFDLFKDLDAKTQKVLLFAFLMNDEEGFSCRSAAARFLQLFYKLAPVRTAHMIAEAYNNGKPFESEMAMMFSLDMINAQGMPREAYLGYQLEQYIKSDGMDNPQRFLDMLKPLFDSIRRGSEDNQELVRAFGLLKFETQLSIIEYAEKNLEGEDFEDIYRSYFLLRFQRMLMGQFVIADPVIYFSRKLAHQGVRQQYINWTKWGRHKALLKQLLTEVETNVVCTDDKNECAQKVYDRKGWGYLVLQRQGDALVPLYGAELLALLQRGFDEESIQQAQTHAVVVDETCPRENIDELMRLLETDHKAYMTEEILRYLKGESALENVESYLRCGIHTSQIDSFTNYSEYSLRDVIWKLAQPARALGLNAMALVSPDLLKPKHGQFRSEYYKQLMEADVDRYAVFRYLMSIKDWQCLSSLALAVDISAFIKKEKVQEQMDLLSIVSHYPQYHPLVLRYKNSKVPKLKKHVETLIAKHRIG